jgi:uncharacterized OB-fold protein
MTTPEQSTLSQSFELGFTYSRSLGPIMSRFFTELKNSKILGVEASDGTVYAPPVEFDPRTGEALSKYVEVSSRGKVKSWCWVKTPRKSAPLQQPFAWALIQLDGANSSMLHVVNAPDETHIHTGMEVEVRWATKTRGHISDIAYFEAV